MSLLERKNENSQNRSASNLPYSDPEKSGGTVVSTEQMDSKFQTPEILFLSKPSTCKTIYGPTYFSCFRNATVQSGSDIVQTEHGGYYSKSRHPLYGSLIPADIDFISGNESTLSYTVVTNPSQRVSVGFSLLGLYDSHWAHFLAQYFPKLRFLDEALARQSGLKLIVPQLLDRQSRSLIEKVIRSMNSKVELLYVAAHESVFCDTLYYADNQSWLADTQVGPGSTCVVVPNKTVDYVKKQFDAYDCETFVERPHRKLYLRRSSMIRNTTNLLQIDEVMQSHGFEIVEPDMMTMGEKKIMFREAKFIVGQFSSAFTNIILCRRGTKVLALSNSYRIGDAYIPSFASAVGLTYMMLIGNDVEPNEPHSSYHINPLILSEIIEAELKSAPSRGTLSIFGYVKSRLRAKTHNQ